MSTRLVYALTVLVLCTGATLARIESADGPIPSVTGAPAVGGKPAEQLCVICHDSEPPNSVAGGVEILGVPSLYVPGTSYPLTVRLRTDATAGSPARKWGFQITAVRASDGEGAGTFIVPDPDTLQIVSGSGAFASRSYVEHAFDGTRAGLDPPVQWTLSWQAPPTAQGTLYFFCAGNAADGGGAPNNDFIFTTADTTMPESNAGIGSVAATRASLAAPCPNPARGAVSLGYTLATPGHVTLAVFDLHGRRVRTLETGWHPAGSSRASWDGRRDGGEPAAAGAYFARLSVAGEPHPLVRTIVLER